MNKYRPHIYILPEDDAYRQIANGFRLETETLGRCSQVMPLANGWVKVRDKFVEEYKDNMTIFEDCYVILLIDFDEDATRLAKMKEVTEGFEKRVFILSVWSDADKLKTDWGSISFEEIGSRLAKQCLSGNYGLWNHELLRHNAAELARMEAILKPLFFP